MSAWRILAATVLGMLSLVLAAVTPTYLGIFLGLIPMLMAISLAQEDGAERGKK